MVNRLVTYQLKSINHLINHRKGEIKFGERLHFITEGVELLQQIKSSEAKFVLFGIPEDVGVRLNYGRPGASNAWQATLQALLNTQNNPFNKGKRLLLLGHLDFSKELNSITALDTNTQRNHAHKIVQLIDKEVTYLVQQIVGAGKIPIAVGGGHNNAYGMVKGCSLALNRPVNILNIDAHTDFRLRDVRHSGNPFSYAYTEGFLKKYAMFGLHENYTPKIVVNAITQEVENFMFTTYEQLFIRREKDIETEISAAIDFVKPAPFGLEIDCDSVQNMPSSAMSPTGFSVDMVRNIVHRCSRNKNILYMHIAEGAPNPASETEMQLAGKFIAHLITDFIRK